MESTENLQKLAKDYRRKLFEKFLVVGQGHPGSVFSMIEIVVSLFHGGFVRFDDAKKKFRDRVLISKGHATVALYPILAHYGVLPQSEWDNWGKSATSLRVFGNTSIAGIDVTSGSLGHGVGVGAGMAISHLRDGKDSRVFVVISEGELYEGSTWEGLLLVSHYNLGKLTVIVDINSLIILGTTGDCLALNPIKEKVAGLGMEVIECNGHDFDSLIPALEKSGKGNKPTIILANTVKGKGFSLMENQAKWHYWNPVNEDQVALCRKEIA
jgi:transketolase